MEESTKELIVSVQPDGEIELEWLSAEPRPEAVAAMEQRVYDKYSGGQPGDWLLELAFADIRIELSASLHFWRSFAGNLALKLRQVEDLDDAPAALPLDLSDAELRRCCDDMPLIPGSEYVTVELLEASWEMLKAAFRKQLAEFNGTTEEFVQSFNPDIHLAGRVYFHLVENRKGEQPFAFMATYSTRVGASGKSRHVPLKFALKEFAGRRDALLELLSTVYAAARQSELIAGLIESGELFHPLSWSATDAHTFLKETPLYEQAGVLCRIPNWWKAKASRVALSVSLGDEQPSRVGLDAIISMSPSLNVDGMPISEDEIRQLLQENDGLAFLKNRWVPVDKAKLQQTLDAYEKARDMIEDGLTLGEAMRLQLEPGKGFGGDALVEVTNGEWLERVVAGLRDPQRLEETLPDDGFTATLRPYQQRGLNWLWFLRRLGLGACLADDMGLGKTIQILAFLNVLKRCEPGSSSLLVVPASLLGNWIREAKTFFPGLRIYGAHPSLTTDRKAPKLSPKDVGNWDLTITTYALVQRYEWLQKIDWSCVIIDEAQAIKNPGTAQSKAVKKLKAKTRIALTGTPVENRLGDLWSIFDFLNAGLLGSAAEFKRFAKGLRENADGYGRLRQIIAPYILRRLKTDKSIIADLPDKVEMKTYAELTKKQVVLYRKLTDDLMEMLKNAEGIQRRGLVLASLMKFKQLCNHPDQYLGQDGYDPDESGKFQRLREICEIVQQKRERMLVFTQFREMTQPLHDYLADVFGRPGVVLHGQVAVGKRKKIVDRFQGRNYVPFMVLSIKAGGVGLNLTKANHVVHFDRWWNPAVENQATDRAFRIGQQRDVLVHKFVTRGSIEERIDEMIEDKKEMAGQVVGKSNQNWVTELDNTALQQMFTLSL